MSEFPDPPYFHVRDLATRWKQTEATIESFINTGELPGVAEYAAMNGCREIVIYVSDADLQDREPNPEEELEVQDFTVRDGVLHVRADDYFVGNRTPAQAVQRALDLKEADLNREYKMDRVVLLADVLAFEKQNGIKTKPLPVRGIETLNTPDHPAYAPELAAAVEVWLRVYGDMKTADDLKKLKDRGKEVRKQKYAEALKSCGIPGLEGEGVLSRLLTVCNPQATKQKGVNLPD